MTYLKHLGFGLFASIMAISTGCFQQKTAENSNSITFDSILVDRSYHLLNVDTNPNCNLKLKYIFPSHYANSQILTKIQGIFNNAYFGEGYANLSPQAAMEKYVAEYIENYKTLEPDYLSEVKQSKEGGYPVGAWFGYYEIAFDEILFNEQDIVSFMSFIESYTGGAHGAHAQKDQVINLKTGELITEAQIFVDNYQDDLAKLLVAKIAKDNNLENPKELENIGFFSIDDIYPNGNFWVNNEGITYTFNEYEIAAYVVGRTQVFIPYAEMKNILRPESPISSLINN